MATDEREHDDPATPAPGPTEMAGRRTADADHAPEPGGPERAEAERLRKELKETNRKAAADRARLKELEQAEADRQAAQMSESDRIRKAQQDADRRAREAEERAEAAAARLAEKEVEFAVTQEAYQQGWPNPELAWRLIDRDRIATDPDTGKMIGVKEAVEKVAKQYPYLPGGATRGGGTPPRGNGRGAGTAGSVPTAEELAASLMRSGKYQHF
jgi:hypothetical protein